MPKRIDTLTPQEAAERLRNLGVSTSPDKIRCGIQQGVYPFGECVVMPKNREFIIYERLFNEWIEKRTALQEIT